MSVVLQYPQRDPQPVGCRLLVVRVHEPQAVVERFQAMPDPVPRTAFVLAPFCLARALQDKVDQADDADRDRASENPPVAVGFGPLG